MNLIDPAIRERALSRYQAGDQVKANRLDLAISRETLCRWCREANLPLRKQPSYPSPRPVGGSPVAQAVIAHDAPGRTAVQVAELAGCSLSYVTKVRRKFREGRL